MNFKNTLLALPFQYPLILVLGFGVHHLTDLNVWWCILIASVLIALYDFGETIRRNDR
jgi:hypothetical protein